MKQWKRAAKKTPEDGQEIIGVFSHMKDTTFHAVKAGDEYFGWWGDGDPERINGDLVCWLDMPKSPFRS